MKKGVSFTDTFTQSKDSEEAKLAFQKAKNFAQTPDESRNKGPLDGILKRSGTAESNDNGPTESGYEGAARTFQQKAVQFPEYDEESVIMMQAKEMVKKALHNLRAKNLSLQGIQDIDELESKRAAYEIDSYVKMTEVRKVVNEGLNSIVDKIKKSDFVAKSNRTEINNLETRLKVQDRKVSRLLGLDKSITTVGRQCKDNAIAIIEVNNKLSSEIEVVSNKNIQLTMVTDELDKNCVRLEAISEVLASRIKELEDCQEKLRQDVHRAV